METAGPVSSGSEGLSMTALAFLSHTERERERDAQRSWPTGSPAGPDHHKPANPDREDTCRSSALAHRAQPETPKLQVLLGASPGRPEGHSGSH